MAAESVQPVPWVLRVSMRVSVKTCSLPSASNNTSLRVSPGMCPPLTSTAEAPRCCSVCAASSMSSTDSMFRSASRRASGKLGVMSVLRGASSCNNTAAALCSIRVVPVVAVTTGSSTTKGMACVCSACVSARMPGASGTIPILAASQPTSDKMESICVRSIAAGVGTMDCTPTVFCAVKAVMAVMP